MFLCIVVSELLDGGFLVVFNGGCKLGLQLFDCEVCIVDFEEMIDMGQWLDIMIEVDFLFIGIDDDGIDFVYCNVMVFFIEEIGDD